MLYWESYGDVPKALARETQLKGWSRAKKIVLIVRKNPHWWIWLLSGIRECVQIVGICAVRLTSFASLLRSA